MTVISISLIVSDGKDLNCRKATRFLLKVIASKFKGNFSVNWDRLHFATIHWVPAFTGWADVPDHRVLLLETICVSPVVFLVFAAWETPAP